MRSQLKEYNKTPNRIQNISILLVNVKEKLSELVRRRINELGLTNAELARRVNLSRGYIGNIVNETAPTQSGQYNLSPETVKSLAKELKISENEILSAMNYLADGKVLPSELAIIDYDGFDEQDLEEIAEYINFKRAQKEKKKAM